MSEKTPNAAIKGLYEKVPESGVWWIRYADSRGRIRREKAGTKAAALNLYRKRKTEVLQGKKLPEQFRRRVTFDELAKDATVHAEAHNAPAAVYDFKCKVEVFKPIFGNRAAGEITKQEIVAYLTKQMKVRNWKPATANRWQAAFSLIYRVGMDNEKIDRNPAARIRRKIENTVVRFLSDEEEQTIRAIIARRCPKHLPAFDLSLHTGMRAGEQFSLKWEQIDFSRKMLVLPKTKNGKMRHIPLNAVAMAALQQLRMRVGSPYVFVNRYGDRMENQRDWFDPIIVEAALPGYTWHVNRHTFASRLVMAGVDLRTVAELMGHRTIQMTMRYAHLAPAHSASAVDALCAPKSQKLTDTRTSTGRVRAGRSAVNH
jgi:site-specific recombinase XerD